MFNFIHSFRDSDCKSGREYTPHILFLANLLLSYWLSRYLSLVPFPSVDLPGHVALIERLAFQIQHGNLIFYDPAWFTGFPAFQFYGFLAHLLTAVLTLLTGLSVELLVQILIFSALVFLPQAFYYFTKNLVPNFKQKTALAVFSGVFAFAFINFSTKSSWVGLEAAFHKGLYAQVFAWLLLLYAAGGFLALAREMSRKKIIFFTIISAALILTHPLTAFFFYVLAACFVLFQARRLKLLCVLLLPCLLTSCWWYGVLYYPSGSFSLLEQAPRFITCILLFLIATAGLFLAHFIKSKLCIAFITLGVVVFYTFFPSPQYVYAGSEHIANRYYYEDLLLTRIAKEKNIGRIAFEYFNDYKLVGYLAPHYLSSKIWDYRVETINGLLIQSSSFIAHAATAGQALGIDTYAPYTYLYKGPRDIETALDKYRSFGVSHLVLTNPNVIQRLKTYGLSNIEPYGPYAFVRISETPPPLILPEGPRLGWSEDFQTLHIHDLTPGKTYTLNYTYFPRWKISGGELMKTFEGKMLITATSKTVLMEFK